MADRLQEIKARVRKRRHGLDWTTCGCDVCWLIAECDRLKTKLEDVQARVEQLKAMVPKPTCERCHGLGFVTVYDEHIWAEVPCSAASAHTAPCPVCRQPKEDNADGH